MHTYILILTLAMMNGNHAGAGHGGLATAEFNSKIGCETAGDKWISDIKEKTKCRYRMEGNLMYICVEKIGNG